MSLCFLKGYDGSGGTNGGLLEGSLTNKDWTGSACSDLKILLLRQAIFSRDLECCSPKFDSALILLNC
jgi:hypothetical protein